MTLPRAQHTRSMEPSSRPITIRVPVRRYGSASCLAVTAAIMMFR